MVRRKVARMIPVEKQFSINRVASEKQAPIRFSLGRVR